MYFENKQNFIAMHRKTFKGVLVISLVILLSACQPKSSESENTASNTSQNATASNPSMDGYYIESKTIALKPKQARVCDEQGCTDYRFQTVETNHAWINEYFKERIEKADPVPFVTSDKDAQVRDVKPQDLSESEIMVRYIGQNQHLATFELTTNVYSAGSAHGMYHNEYVNFDLRAKKRIALEDLMEGGVKTKLRDAIFDTNSNWLNDHTVDKNKLYVSDNFYYGADGIVFVYPLYELASYSEGMSELTLPYHYTAKLIKPKYLPNLPRYAQD